MTLLSRTKNGMDCLVPCLDSHKPLDLTILMLGSNDMKVYFSPSVEKIAGSLAKVCQTILMVSEAPVLLVSPIYLGDNMADSDFATSFPPSSIAISHELGGALEEVARQLDIPFFRCRKVTPAIQRRQSSLNKRRTFGTCQINCQKSKRNL